MADKLTDEDIAALEDLNEALQEQFGEDMLQFMADMARLMGVLDAIVAVGSTDDLDAVTEWLHKDKGEVISVEQMREIVDFYLPILIEDEMVADGKPTAQGIEVSTRHRMLMEGGDPTAPIH